jgi:hypothetical protein
MACAVAAVFGLSCVVASAEEITRTDEVRINPEVQRNAHVAKKKTKRAARKAKHRTKRAANRGSAAAHRAADRTRAAVRPDNSRGEAVVERNR